MRDTAFKLNNKGNSMNLIRPHVFYLGFKFVQVCTRRNFSAVLTPGGVL